MSEKILIIDDHHAFSDFLKKQMTLEGYTVFTARNGWEGLCKAKQVHPGLILLDVSLPGEDGWKTLDKLLHWVRSSIVMMSVSPEEEEQEKIALQHGARGYLCKPFAVSALGQYAPN